SGDDIVLIDTVDSGSNFHGAVSINTGAGNDTIQINGAGAAATSFLVGITVNQGTGDDSLELGNTGPIKFFKVATFRGGATGDVNNTLLDTPTTTSGASVPPTLTNYHSYQPSALESTFPEFQIWRANAALFSRSQNPSRLALLLPM